MSDINVVTLSGRLTRDAERKTLPTGTQLTEVSLANNTGFGDHQKTAYFTVNMWGKFGEGVFPYLKKGQAVGVSGELEVQKWTTQEGQEKTKLVIKCNQLTLLGGKKQEERDAYTYDPPPENGDVTF